MNLEKEDKIINDKLNEYVEFDAFDKHEIWNRIEDQLSKSKEKKFPIYRYVSIAAIMILFIGIYFATVQSKNNSQKGTLNDILVKSEPHSINADTSYSNLAVSSKRNAKNEKIDIVEHKTKEHLNILNNSTVVSNNSISNDIQEPILEKANLATVLENQTSINSDSKSLNVSSPSTLAFAKNNLPKRKYTIVHINELGRSNESNYLYYTGANEKLLNSSYQQNNLNEQQDVQKYLTIKILLNKSSNSLNDDHEK